MSSSEPQIEPGAVSIREYQPQDFPRLCVLDRICFAPGIAYSPEEIAAAFGQARTFCLVAADQDEVIGFVLTHYRRAVGHIITIDIHPDYRGHGIGSRLMEMSERRLAELGIHRVVLEVAVSNQPAIAFYGGRGYLQQRLLPHYYRDHSDAFLMEKAL